MSKRYWLGGLRIGLILAAVLLGAVSSYAQPCPGINRKSLPTLTLIKTQGNPQTDVLSNPLELVAEAGTGEKQYFLLPVYIKNCLDSITNPITGLTGEPIYSFRFKIQYNRTLLRAVGVQKRGPLPGDTDVAAKTFNVSWDVDQDASYKVSSVGAPSANGERIMISGSSSLPLPLPLIPNAPNNSCQFRDTAVFLYVLFEVVGNSQGGVSGANRDQLILTRDSILWNDYSPATTTTEMLNRCFELNQVGVSPAPVFPITYPNNYGVAEVQVTPRPRIDLLPQAQVVAVDPDRSLYQMTAPLTTTYGNPNFIYRQLLLVNGIASTTLRNVTVETDQPWLFVDTNLVSGSGGIPTGNPFDRAGFVRKVVGQVPFNVVANPALLPSSDGSSYPTPGIYVGTITLHSNDARNSAVRLRVPLIVFRNPLEPVLPQNSQTVPPEPIQTRGIRITFRNSATRPDTTYLTFGTGVGARDTVDSLFGEAEAPAPANPGSFFARFFPPSITASGANFNGLVDWRGVAPRSTNGENSIDIRDYKTNTTLTYCVQFGAGGPQNYPVVLEYDVRDFPIGSQIFIRDNVNGSVFSSDLRKATPLGGTRYAFFIRDPNVTGFCFEYTIPSVVQFPKITQGWNFVSLPVNPSDNRAGVVFPNIASGKPIRFTQNQYSPEDTVAVGVGYFVKYGSILDLTVAGTPFYEINETVAPFYTVRLYKGWNTVGGISVQTSVDSMTFGPINPTQPVPALVGEVYRYNTDRGYEQTSIISPGFGYWIKVNGDGYYRLRNLNPIERKMSVFDQPSVVTGPYTSLNRLYVSDNAQKIGTLYFGQSANIDNAHYELPPVPATDMFDVRFDNQSFVSASANAKADRVVKLNGVTYPVVLSVDKADADYVISDAVTGQVYGSFTRGQAGAVRIANPMAKSVKISGVAANETALIGAFPNPTGANTTISFSVAGEQHVNVTLFNAIGGQVATIFDATVAGQQNVDFSTNGLAAGVYYYKMTTSTGYTEMRQLVVAR
jgi:hypothetical protein